MEIVSIIYNIQMVSILLHRDGKYNILHGDGKYRSRVVGAEGQVGRTDGTRVQHRGRDVEGGAGGGGVQRRCQAEAEHGRQQRAAAAACAATFGFETARWHGGSRKNWQYK